MIRKQPVTFDDLSELIDKNYKEISRDIRKTKILKKQCC